MNAEPPVPGPPPAPGPSSPEALPPAALAAAFAGTGLLRRPPADPTARTLCPVGEAVAAGILVHRADGTVAECNRAAEEIFGLERDRLIGCNPVAGGSCRSLDAAGRPLTRATHPCTVAADTGRAVRGFELGLEFPGRPRRYLTLDAVPFPAAADSPALVVSTVVDITARKALETALRAGEARFRTYLENATEAVFVHDFSARFSYVNPQACRSLGYNEEELLRLSVPEVDIALDLERARDVWRAMVPGSNAVFTGTHRRKDGTTFPVEIQAGCFESDGQRHYIAHVRDVSEQVRARAAERAHHERLRRIGDNLPHGYIYRVERRPGGPGRFTYLGAGVSAVHGIDARCALDDPALLLGQILPADRARFAAAEEASYRALAEFAVDFRFQAADGSLRWLSVNSTPHRHDDGTVVWDGVALDVTARRQAEAEHLVRAKLEATAGLAAGLAHDFNNLLAVILLNLDRARAVGPDLASAHRCLAAATTAVGSARTLTRRLLTLAEGGTPLRAPADVGAVAREALELALRDSNVTAAVDLDPDLCRAEVDAGQLAQVIRNLALNAREAMPAGGRVTLRGINHVVRPGDTGPLPPGGYVRLSLADTGPGIPPEILPRVFDPYFSTKPRGAQKGMGLGLTLCRAIVGAHRGELELFSGPGAGTTAHLYLPAVATPPAEQPASRPAPTAPAPAARILVMDDDESLRSVIGLSLELMGHRVELAADSPAALAAFHTARAAGRPFQLVLLDLTVPGGKGGLETWRELRGLDPALRGLVMSGYADGDALRRWADYGLSGALTKPFETGILAAALDRALAP